MIRLKSVLAVGLVALMAFTFGACGSTAAGAGSSNDGTQAVKSGDITVAGVVYLEDQFMKLLTSGYKDAAEASGAKFLSGNVNNDQAKEADLINTYMTQGINGIAIAPLNEESSQTTLKAAAAKGIKISLTDSTLKDTSFTVGGYTSDQKQLGSSTGKVAAKFIQEKLGGKANIAIVEFKSLLPEKSSQRVSGFLEEVQKLPGVKVVADQDAWVQDKAVSVAGDILTANPDVDIIFAANDGGTVGSTMAVKNAGRSNKTYVFGIDASEQIAAMLKDSDNILQAVTGQDAYTMGYKSMEALIKNIKGEQAEIKAGEMKTVDGILLSRDDSAGIDKFLSNLKEKAGN